MTGNTSAIEQRRHRPSSTGALSVGQVVSGAGIATGTTITAKTANTITLSQTPSTSATGVTLYFSYTNRRNPLEHNPYTLIKNIQNALSLDPNSGTGLNNVLLLSLVSPTVDILPNARLSIMGAIDDSSGPVAGDGTTSDLTEGSDLYLQGGGELNFEGPSSNTYRGTTYVQQGSLTLSNSLDNAPLGTTPANAGTQSLILTNAIPGKTYFTLSFNGDATSPILYQGTTADVAAIQSALAGLASVNGNVEVLQANPGVFLVTFTASLASTNLVIVPAWRQLELSTRRGLSPARTLSRGSKGELKSPTASQIQLQGGVTVNNEPLVIQGEGSNVEPTVQTFTVGGNTAADVHARFQRANDAAFTSAGGHHLRQQRSQIEAALPDLRPSGPRGGRQRHRNRHERRLDR